jgi:hypothetical protein
MIVNREFHGLVASAASVPLEVARTLAGQLIINLGFQPTRRGAKLILRSLPAHSLRQLSTLGVFDA